MKVKFTERPSTRPTVFGYGKELKGAQEIVDQLVKTGRVYGRAIEEEGKNRFYLFNFNEDQTDFRISSPKSHKILDQSKPLFLKIKEEVIESYEQTIGRF
tara:strand:+ start:3424 stop:3723 length:300 start_codon:yes stop_codon:yes gene_type:complete